MTAPPEFIYFDLGNVLINFCHRRGTRQLSEVAGISETMAWEALFGGDLHIRFECGVISPHEVCEEFCAATNANASHELLLLAMSDIFELNVSVVPIVVALSQAGHRLGILSNTNTAHWEFVANGRYTVLNRHFELRVLSFEEGAMKPDRAIYTAAIERCGVAARRIFFVDDRPENVAGARQAGIDAVPFTSPHQLAADLRARGVSFNY